jgi:hypothetical protein
MSTILPLPGERQGYRIYTSFLAFPFDFNGPA